MNYQNHPELDPTSRIADERMFHIVASTDTIAGIYSDALTARNTSESNDELPATSASVFSDLNDRINRGEV